MHTWLTGCGIMGVGDAAVQAFIEHRTVSKDPDASGRRPAACPAGTSDFDFTRLGTSAVFQGFSGVFMVRWWRHLDAFFPTPSLRKLAVNQLVLSGSLTPLMLVWSATVEAPLRGISVDWAGLGARLTTELPTLLPTSVAYWLPIHVVNLFVLPPHLRVVWTSAGSVAWGGYLSYVAHGRGALTTSAVEG